MTAKKNDSPTPAKESREHGYAAFPPSHILPGTSADFPIYLKQSGNYVLYTKLGERFSDEQRVRLADQGVDTVYIPAQHKKEYEAYIRDNLAVLLDDEAIPLDERAETWNGTVRDMARGVFEERLPGPTLKARAKRMEGLIRNSARFFSDPRALKELSKFIARGYGDYRHGIGVMVFTSCVLQTFDADELLLTSCGLGALLHDIGRARLPRHILDADPASMDEREFCIYASHPAIGVQLSASIPLVPEAIHCVLFHHERMDGKGFPSGAVSDEIPFYARAVAVCNAYDNLTRVQPWRPALTPFEALTVIREDVGGQDPDMFTRLVGVLAAADIT